MDFAARRQALDRIDALLAQPASDRAAGIASMLKDWNDGAVKLLVTAAGRRLRAADPELFLEGDLQHPEPETVNCEL